MEPTPPAVLNVFDGPGEMRARARELDWAATPLGPVELWPPMLRAAAQIVMATGLPNIVLWGRELIQIYNDAYARLIGGKHPLAFGRGNREVWPEVWHINGPIYERVFQGETVTFADAHYPLRRRGVVEDVYLTISYSPIRDESGDVGGVLVNMVETTREVEYRALETERERLYRALDVERARLEFVFRHAPAFLAVLRGPEHVIELANEAYRRLVANREIVGKPLFEALPEARGQGFEALLDGVLGTGEPYHGREVPALLQHTPDAPPEKRFLDLACIPLVEADGTRSGVIAHGIDVTDHVHARRDVERLLAESDAARAALERAADRTTRLQRVSSALGGAVTPEEIARAVVQESAAALEADAALVVLLDDERRALRVVDAVGLSPGVISRFGVIATDAPFPIAEAVRTGQAVIIESLRERTARYGPALAIAHESSVSVPLLVQGEVVGGLGLTFARPRAFTDSDVEFLLAVGRQCAQAVRRGALYAAAEEARAAAERARAEAEAASRARGEFLGVMSHELRTPLNAIGGYAELMELELRGPITPQQREDLRRIQQSQKHLLGLINEVLNYTRIETGTVRYDVREVPAARAIDDAEVLVQPQVRARGLTLAVERGGTSVVVLADEEKLRQILLNLLGNAIKFTDAGGRITITCVANADTAAISVADTGIGIQHDKLDGIFDPFVQVNPHLTRTHEGVGLGLAISRDLARGMGGDLTAQSAPGAGSTFTLTLPLAGVSSAD